MKKHIDRAFLACLLAVLLAVPAAVALWSHRETTAYYENRVLAQRPALTWESLWDGSFGADLESWYSDHAPGRSTFLKADTALQMELLGRPVVNGIVHGGSVLLPQMSYTEWSRTAYEETVPPIAQRFAQLEGHIAANGGDFYFVGFPEQRVYFEDRFPAYMNSHAAEAETADQVFRAALEGQGSSLWICGRSMRPRARRSIITPRWTTTSPITGPTRPTGPFWTGWAGTGGSCRC